jgi:16S rRNA (cytosine967-C5)-methyltransferase
VLEVIDELNTLGYPFERDDVCIRFESNYPLQDTRSFASGFFEIQDIASQQTATMMHPQKNQAWWDCCAGSGGKSLLLLEQERQIQLFVSDNRESILHNLQDRFAKAGIRQFAAVLADLEMADDTALRSIPDMQGIIADVPCSGSGTWARSPERMSFFTASDLQFHVAQQRNIMTPVVSKLLSGGQLLYLTCSVYSDENESQVDWMQKTFGLTVITTNYFQHSDRGGDTLFGALLSKP